MSYPIHSSPLYGINSIHKLAEALHVEVRILRDLDQICRAYHVKEVEVPGKKKRTTETPIRNLRRIHDRVKALLIRIEFPPYLHSGRKGRSYITNAKAHMNQPQTFNVDITNFYPSTSWYHIYRCFNEQFDCKPDIAGKIATLLTYKEHLPTGSPISTNLSFFAHKKMFDKLQTLATEYCLTMTLFQDDITFSGDSIPEDFRKEVRVIIKRQGLSPNRSKQRFYHGGRKAKVTGIIVGDERLFAPKQRHLSLRHSLDDFFQSVEPASKRMNYFKAMGKASEIEMVENRISGIRNNLRVKFRNKKKTTE
ncbi:MAG: reverse transcriptase family protein [Proteobacteria bacterium]|nr:reverse transcriptase family protein [Pseudomonadota bacterium]